MLDFPRVTGGLAVAIALLALVATVGGTSYAAARIAANSVGTPQLKDDAVTSAKIENRSLKAVDLKAGLAKKHVTEIDVSMGLGTKEDAIRVPGVGLMDLFCVSNQVYTYLEKKSGTMSNALVITGVRTDDGRVPAYRIEPDHPAIAAATAALEEVYPGQEVLLAVIAGTLPATTLFEEALGAKTLFFSFATADEQHHAPNEFLRIARLREGMHAWQVLWDRLAAWTPADAR